MTIKRSAAGQPAELLHQQAADGVVFFIGKGSGKKFIEIGDRRQRAHREFARTFLADGLIILDVMLIIDLADDLFDDILDGDQAAHTAIFVDHHGNVIMAAAKFLEQHVETLALRHEYHRAHVFAYLEILIRRSLQPQQVLGEQDSQNLIAILADHGKARMPGLDHQLDQFLRRLVALDEHHLRARHHDVPYLHVRDGQHALEHPEAVRTWGQSIPDQRYGSENPSRSRI